MAGGPIKLAIVLLGTAVIVAFEVASKWSPAFILLGALAGLATIIWSINGALWLIDRWRVRKSEAAARANEVVLAAAHSSGEPEYIPLMEAGRWLYDNGAPWLRDHLKDPKPFDSIAEHAAAFVGEACDAGAGELVASREPGLNPEPTKYKEMQGTAFSSAFGDKPLPVNPMVRSADLPSILAYYEEPAAPREPLKVRRDARLSEALMYVVKGAWGLEPMSDGGGALGALADAVRDFRQLALDGVLTVWGRTSPHDVWVPIQPKYWRDHEVHFLDLMRAETKTTKINIASPESRFTDLMVSRAEFELEFPPGRQA